MTEALMQGEMSDLIARLEAASEGSRELDADICEALGFEVKRHAAPRRGRRPGISWRLRGESRWEYLPRATTEIDDALRLIPPHSLWIVGQQEDAIARVLPPTGDGWTGSKEITATARTPALALCIAALRARAPAPGSQT